LFFDEARQTYCIPGQYFLPPTNFTTDEALAVILLCHELGTDQRLPFCSAAVSAAAKLENQLPQRLVEYLRSVASSVRIKLDATTALAGQQAAYELFLTAIADRHPVRITYESLHEKQQIETKLQPYRLLFNQHSWYVIGRSSVHREVRTFNLARVRQWDLLRDETFQSPKNFSLDRYLGNAWRLIPEPGDDYAVQLRFRPRVARNVAEVMWHRTQRAEVLADGSLDFFVTVSGLNEISWWIMGYGDQVEVLSPPALRTLIADRAANMVRLYGHS
jgi:proteasome accessory factor B